MRDTRICSKSASLKLTALFYLLGLLVLPSTATAWDYQLQYTVPADGEVDEYRVYLELGLSGYQFYTQVQGPLAPYVIHTYNLVGLPDDQDVSIVMTSCRFDDGLPVESINSNELFFPVDPSCVDGDCDDGNPCTLDYCLNDACTYDAAAMDGQFCDDGDAGNDPDSCSDGICTGTPVTIFGVTALSGISDGATVSGELYIEALVSAGTESVRFYLDGAEFRVESAPPYGFNSDNGPGALIPWDTASVANGLHSITATGHDQDGGAGQVGTSVSVSFNVQNTTPDCVDDADCTDGDLCNGDEWCNPGVGACLLGTALTCLDPGPCQTASCDATLGCAVYALANGTSCEDGDPATHTDVCTNGSCAGTPTDCSSKKQNANSCKNTRGNQKGGRGRGK
jgi:hypothetical protein